MEKKENLWFWLEFILTSVSVALHGWLFRDTFFTGLFESETSDSAKSAMMHVLNNPVNIF